ncbi:MAG: PAS domain S-box protein [Xenococcaceae cyanobacterium MO_188.B32]|nr:PAS domain S-box protein [Xenococcaceae cyanobacterium MO_188.B32]
MQSNNFFSLEQVIDRNPLRIAPDAPLTEVIRLMHEWGNSCFLSENIDPSEASSTAQINNSCALVVVDSQLRGILTERDLVRLIAEDVDLESMTVAEVMSRELITLTTTGIEDIFTALNLLRQHRIRHLPVRDERDRLLGLITEKTIRQNLQPINFVKWRRVEEIMTTSVVHALPTTSVRQVAQLMANHKVSCVAIVEERERDGLLIPMGIITERDIVQFQTLSLDLEQPAQKLMSSPLFLVSPEDSLWSVHELMEQRRVRRLLVAGSQGELAGIITQTSLLQVFGPTEMYGIIEELQRKVCQLELERAEFLQNRTAELEQQVRTELNKRQQVETTKKHLAVILETTTDFVGMADINGRTLYLNRAGRKMMGFGEDEDLSNITVSDYHAPWAVKIVNEGLAHAIHEGVWSGEIALLNRDGREIPVSQVIIAHKESDRSVTSFSTIIRDISDRKEIEADLQYRVEFEQLIARIATRFINLTSAEIDREIEYSLQTIGEFTQVDTSYVFQISGESNTMSMTHEWVKPEIKPNIQQAQNLPFALFPWSIAQLQQGEILQVPSVANLPIANLPTEAEIDRQNWQRFNLRSLIAVPLICQGTFSGWLGFASFNKEEAWSESSINLLRIIGEMFVNALQRRQAEQALRESEQRFDNILSSLEDVVWSVDPHTFETLYINSAVAKIYGRQVAEFYDNPYLWLEVVHPEDRDRVSNVAQNLIETEASEIKYRIVKPDGEIRWLYERARLIRDAEGKPIRLDGITTDISDRQRREEILKDIASGMTVKIGENFLLSLVEYLSKTLQVDYAFIGELIKPEEDSIKTLAVYGKGKPIENFEYPLADAPCENVVGQQLWIYPEAVQQLFPRDRLLQEMAVESYAGFPIYDSAKRPFGLIAILDSKPFDDTSLIEEVLKIFATRATTELERQEAESKIRKQAALLNLTQDTILVRNLENTITFWNHGAVKMYGWTASEALGKNSHQLLRAKFDRLLEQIETELFREGHWEGELIHQRKDGTAITVMGRWSLLKDASGNPEQILEINHDITKRKQAEAKIREQAALLDVATDAIIVRGLEHKILFWNRGAEKLYGWTKAEAIERDANQLLYQESLTKLNEIQQAVREKGEWQGELNQITKAGKDIVVESRWTLVKDKAGNPQSFLVVNTDITEKKQLEAQFLRTQRLESLGTLASGIAHDLNNILTPILAVTQLLPRHLPDLDKNLQQLLSICQSNVKRGADLVKQILTFTRGAQGERGIVQVKHLIAEIKQIAEETFPKTIEIQTSVAKNLWTVNGDATQLHQVLMNLTVNARDAMANGGTLGISAENFALDRDYARMHLDAREGEYILVTVSDTGVGIPADIQERVFEPFFTTKEIGHGTGLGLSTVLGIVKSHGGFIDINSEVGRGSQFRVFLPADQTTATVAEEIEEFPRGNGELILVVDDEAPIRSLGKTILETYNYRVLTASDGIEAIALYSQHQDEIEVVLMDIMMPFMDGRVAIRTLQKIKPQVKIIAVSGLVTREIGTELKDGCLTFLAKPYTTEALLTTIHKVINC